MPLSAHMFGICHCRRSPPWSVLGAALALWRVLRCNPFGRGGFDPVPGTYPGPASAQMTPAIYHKIVAFCASARVPQDRPIDRNSLWQKYAILISRVAVGRTHALFSSSPSSLF